MAELIARSYSLALFEAGLELDRINEFKEEIKDVNDVLVSDERLLKILEHPKISKDDKKELLNSLFKDNISQEVLNFLYILVDKRREKNITSIYDSFLKEYNDYNGIVEVSALTAVELDEERKEKLAKILSEKMDKTIILKNIVDEDIIGGVILRTDDKVIDGSVKGQLKEIERAIKNVSL